MYSQQSHIAPEQQLISPETENIKPDISDQSPKKGGPQIISQQPCNGHADQGPDQNAADNGWISRAHGVPEIDNTIESSHELHADAHSE